VPFSFFSISHTSTIFFPHPWGVRRHHLILPGHSLCFPLLGPERWCAVQPELKIGVQPSLFVGPPYFACCCLVSGSSSWKELGPYFLKARGLYFAFFQLPG